MSASLAAQNHTLLRDDSTSLPAAATRDAHPASSWGGSSASPLASAAAELLPGGALGGGGLGATSARFAADGGPGEGTTALSAAAVLYLEKGNQASAVRARYLSKAVASAGGDIPLYSGVDPTWQARDVM